MANSSQFPLGASAQVSHHPVEGVCEADGFLGGNQECWLQPPPTALCHLGGGKRAEVEPTEPGAVRGGGGGGQPQGCSRRSHEREMQDAKRAGGRAGTGGFVGGQGAAGTRDKGQGPTHAHSPGKGHGFTPAPLQTFIFKRFLEDYHSRPCNEHITLKS